MDYNEDKVQLSDMKDAIEDQGYDVKKIKTGATLMGIAPVFNLLANELFLFE